MSQDNPTKDKVNPDYDWEVDEKTPVIAVETMAELMETLRSPGVQTLTSERPTRRMRPLAKADV
jgi:hypothetical protein